MENVKINKYQNVQLILQKLLKGMWSVESSSIHRVSHRLLTIVYLLKLTLKMKKKKKYRNNSINKIFIFHAKVDLEDMNQNAVITEAKFLMYINLCYTYPFSP